MPWRKRPWNRYGKMVRLLPPQRFSRKTENMERLINGLYTYADRMPVGYRAIRKDLFCHDVEYDLRARDAAGRPRVIHIFAVAPGKQRGRSPLVPALQVARQFDQLADATLMAAIVPTLFVVTITSPAKRYRRPHAMAVQISRQAVPNRAATSHLRRIETGTDHRHHRHFGKRCPRRGAM